MKKGKKVLLIASTFAVALNMNGCVYGPPSDHVDKSSEQDNAQNYETEIEEDIEEDAE